jgi:hypothetical protein
MEKKYKIGDYVIIKLPDSNTKTVGRIEQIEEEDKEYIIRYNEYYFPDKTSGKYYFTY